MKLLTQRFSADCSSNSTAHQLQMLLSLGRVCVCVCLCVYTGILIMCGTMDSEREEEVKRGCKACVCADRKMMIERKYIESA